MKKILCFLSFLSVLVLVVVFVLIKFFEEYQISAYGSIIAGAGSLLAVIWFTASLWYQSVQLNEQRIQFSTEFRALKEASRRECLVMAKKWASYRPTDQRTWTFPLPGANFGKRPLSFSKSCRFSKRIWRK